MGVKRRVGGEGRMLKVVILGHARSSARAEGVK